MSDTDTSGSQGSAPAETSSAPAGGSPSNSKPAETTAQFGTFGTTRGSGLARGKRAPIAAPATAKSEAPGYQPTAIELITPQREYQNPFAPEQPAPEAATPVEAPKPAPAAPAAVEPTVAPAPKPVAVVPAPVEETKAELKILPPAVTKQPAQSWEASPAASAKAEDSDKPRARHEERPTFRPERRERREQTGEPRTFAPRENREARPAPNPIPAAPAPAAKSGGFVGWLKGLFGDKPAATPASAPKRETERDGGQHDRRHRGGRGRGRNYNGPRDGQFRGNGEGQYRGGGEGRPRPDNQQGEGGGPRRRRRRGGRNRGRDEGGGDRPRPEGQQGGGAI